MSVTNDNGPPALWLTIALPGRLLATDREWDVSLDGAVLRSAVPSSQPLELRPGNPLYGGEGTIDSLRRRWGTLALFAIVASLLGLVCYALAQAAQILVQHSSASTACGRRRRGTVVFFTLEQSADPSVSHRF